MKVDSTVSYRNGLNALLHITIKYRYNRYCHPNTFLGVFFVVTCDLMGYIVLGTGSLELGVVIMGGAGIDDLMRMFGC